MVKLVRVTISQHEYYLSRTERARSVKKRAVRAARHGGGFVAFVLRGGRRISVLVTPQTVVAVETLHRPREAGRRQGNGQDEFDGFYLDETLVVEPA